MENEIKSFILVWISAIISLFYCYLIAAKIPSGKLRLLSLLPIFYLFTILPLNLFAVHLLGPTCFYLTWLANFKLFLFSFDQGPLSLTAKPIPSLVQFISISCLPIKIKQNPSLQSPQTALVMMCRALLLAVVIRIYDYRAQLHPLVILTLYCIHVYLALEIVLAMGATLARALLGLELEPQFNEPYFSTSLQDFWGRRWNLVVTSILRPTVYNPIRSISTGILGSEWAQIPALPATFLVSGLMHELIYYYLTRVSPTWEVTCFFLLHGFCTALEVMVKKAFSGRFELHRAISGPLTLGFVALTGYWLFFPQLTRNHVDDRAINEYYILTDFVKEQLHLL